MKTRKQTLLLAGAAALTLSAVPLVANAQRGPRGDCDGPPGHCAMETMDTDGDGAVTREEFDAGHEARFDEADANGDGFVDADEIVALHPGGAIDRPDDRRDRMVEHVLEHLDADGDGRISREEATAAHSNRFQALDADESGALEGDELDHAGGPHGGGPGMGPGPHGLLFRMDADGDRTVTREEFEAGIEGLWEELDANGDGVIDERDRTEDTRHPPHAGGHGPHGGGHGPHGGGHGPHGQAAR